jgi:four helix bundle protein
LLKARDATVGLPFALYPAMAHKKTSERGYEFACHLIDEFRVRKPTDDAERHIWWQLLDSGPSVGANASESGAAETDPDFVHKFQVSLKEGRETLYWLRLLAYASPDRAKRVNALYDECDEIVAILVSSIKTKRANMERTETESKTKRRHAKKRPPDFFYEIPD